LNQHAHLAPQKAEDWKKIIYVEVHAKLVEVYQTYLASPDANPSLSLPRLVLIEMEMPQSPILTSITDRQESANK
jgi:hypothetical protein